MSKSKSLRAAALLCLIASAVTFPTHDAYAQGTLISVPTRRDMVFDHAGKYLYITTSDGYVQRYNLATGQIDTSFNLGGSLNGLDISSDDSVLLVAQGQLVNSQGKFQKVDLATGSVTEITYSVDPYSGEAGGYSVAIAANGTALITTERQKQTSGGNSFPLRAVDLASNTISVRNDIAGVTESTWINRSLDRTLFSFAGLAAYDTTTNRWTTTLVTYSSGSDSFQQIQGATGGSNMAINRDRSLFARATQYYGGSIDTVSDLTFLHSFRELNAGVAFDPIRDVLYGVDSVNGRIIALDSNTYQELFQLDAGENIDIYPYSPGPFDTGHLVVSPDGRYLALATPSGVRLFTIPTPPYSALPAPDFGEPRGMVFDHGTNYLYVTTTTGFVLGFNVATTNLDRIYNVGGWLYGIDIAPDDSFVVVAQAYPGLKQGAIQRVDLVTGSVSNFNYDKVDSERGAYDVHLAANNRVFFSTSGDSVPIRQIDLQNGAIKARSVPNSQWGTIGGSAQIQRSADGSLLYFLETNNSSGLTFTYNAGTDALNPGGDIRTYFDLTNAAVNRNGTLACIRYSSFTAPLQAAPDFHTAHTFNSFDYGVTFDSVKDVLYGLSSTTDEIIAYDTNTFAELSRMWIGEDLTSASTGKLFGLGSLIASPDGRYLALFAPSAIELIDLQNPPGPRPNFTITASASPARAGTISGAGSYPGGTQVGLGGSQNNGWVFENWTENGSVVATYPYYQFAAYSNRTLVANFRATLPIVATPVISPNGGSFKKKVTVKMSDATAGARIRYTTDGTDPTYLSNVYPIGKKSKGITVTGKGQHVIKAQAVAGIDYIDSDIATAVITIK